jgi:hypothetical protein
MSREKPRRLISLSGGGRRGRLADHLLPGHRYQDHSFLCRFFAGHLLVLRGVCPGPKMAPGLRQALSPVPNHRLPPALAADRRRRVYHRHFPDQVFHRPHLFLRLGPGSPGTICRPMPLKSSGQLLYRESPPVRGGALTAPTRNFVIGAGPKRP